MFDKERFNSDDTSAIVSIVGFAVCCLLVWNGSSLPSALFHHIPLPLFPLPFRKSRSRYIHIDAVCGCIWENRSGEFADLAKSPRVNAIVVKRFLTKLSCKGIDEESFAIDLML